MVSFRGLKVMAVIAALVVALAGFGGTPSGSGKQKARAVCKLLKTREAEEILGTDVRKGKKTKVTPRPGAKASGCEWASKEKGVGGVEGAAFKLVIELQTSSNMARDFERAKAQVTFGELRTVPNLGTDAFYDEMPFNGVHSLVADNRVLSVTVTNFDTSNADLPKTPEEMSIDVARIAAGRLTKN